VNIDGYSLSIAAVTAAARCNASVELDNSPALAERVCISRNVILDKVSTGTSVYGVSTGFGGSGESLRHSPLCRG
jgi:phenylalanine ammonia-lyase